MSNIVVPKTNKALFVDKSLLPQLEALQKQLNAQFPEVRHKIGRSIVLFLGIKTLNRDLLVQYVIQQITTSRQTVSEYLDSHKKPNIIGYVPVTCRTQSQAEEINAVVDDIYAKILLDLHQQLGSRAVIQGSRTVIQDKKILLSLLIEAVVRYLPEKIYTEELRVLVEDSVALRKPKQAASKKTTRVRTCGLKSLKKEIQRREIKMQEYILNKLTKESFIPQQRFMQLADVLYKEYQSRSTRLQQMRRLIKKLEEAGKITASNFSKGKYLSLPGTQSVGTLPSVRQPKLQAGFDALKQHLEKEKWFNYQTVQELLQIYAKEGVNVRALYYRFIKLLEAENVIVAIGSNRTKRFYSKSYADEQLMIDGRYETFYVKKAFDYYHYLRKSAGDPDWYPSLDTIREYVYSLFKDDALDCFLSENEKENKLVSILNALRHRLGVTIIAYSRFGSPIVRKKKPKWMIEKEQEDKLATEVAEISGS